MEIAFKKILLSSQRIKNELGIAFGLILLGMLVFLGYLFPGSSPWFETRNQLYLIVVIVFFILLLGFVIILHLIEPVIKISEKAQKIADGDFDCEISLIREDEIGQLGSALNRMTQRMKENVEELRNFSKVSESINVEINKRILILSNLLQISNLIVQNADLKKITEVAIDKCLSLGMTDFVGIVSKDFENGDYFIEYLSRKDSPSVSDSELIGHKIKLGEGVIGKTILKKEIVTIDHQYSTQPEVKEFLDRFAIKNAVVLPIISKGNIFGIFFVGSDIPDFTFPPAERELFELIVHQIAIAYGNELLNREVEKLSVIDRLTGLYNVQYLRNHLDVEIRKSRAVQGPCSFVLLTVDRFKEYLDSFGYLAAENVLIKVGSLLKSSLGAQGNGARFSDHEFGIILRGKNKRQSIDVAETLRRKVEEIFSAEYESRKKLTCTAVVTENPIDGTTSQDLILKAQDLLKEAKSQGHNRVYYKI